MLAVWSVELKVDYLVEMKGGSPVVSLVEYWENLLAKKWAAKWAGSTAGNSVSMLVVLSVELKVDYLVSIPAVSLVASLVEYWGNLLATKRVAKWAGSTAGSSVSMLVVSSVELKVGCLVATQVVCSAESSVDN